MITSVAGDDKLYGHVVCVNDVNDECDVVNWLLRTGGCDNAGKDDDSLSKWPRSDGCNDGTKDDGVEGG